MYPNKNIAIIGNPAAAHDRSRTLCRQIMDILEGIKVSHTLFFEQWPSDFIYYTDIWIVGGDGTLNYFINRYPDTDLPFTIFPGGSGNDFYWMLYGNRTVEDQVQYSLTTTPRSVDAGICNGRLFLNGVGIGFDGAIVKDLLGKKMLAGKSSYMLAILKNIVAYKEKLCTIELENETIHEECFLISIANGQRYGGGFLVAPKASVNDHLLDVSIIGKIAPLKRIKYLPVMEKGQHLALPFVQYRQSQKITIESAIPLHAHIDGEYLQADRFQIECLPSRFLARW